MKQKILELLPRAGALLAALVVLISSVAVPARAASTSEAVKYYDITDYNMAGTITNGSTVKLTFNVADFVSLYGESYAYSSWDLLIIGQFDGTMLCSSYGANYYSKTNCSYQFKLSSDWIQTPSINCKQENVGVTGTYRITGAYLINSSYVSKHDAYYYHTDIYPNFSSVYNGLYSVFEKYTSAIDSINDEPYEETVFFTPRVIIPCTTLYFEFAIERLVSDSLDLSLFALDSSGNVTEIYDYELTVLTTAEGYYRYGVEAVGPFTDFVFASISFATEGRAEIFFDGFYAGYNRILNTNSLLDRISENLTLILNRFTTRLDNIVSYLKSINDAILRGDLGSKPATNIFDAWNGTISNISGNFQSVVNAVRGISGDIVSGLSSSFNSVTTAVEGIAGDVSNALASRFDSLMDATEGIAGDLISGMPDIVGAVSDIPGKISDAITPFWQSNAFGIVDFTGIVEFFTSGYNSISGVFGFVDIFEDPDGGIGWLPSEDSISDSETTPFISGLRGFWSFSGALVMELPAEVILAFSFVFIGFLFVGFLKSF